MATLAIRSKLGWAVGVVGFLSLLIGLPGDIVEGQRLLNEIARIDWLSFVGSDAFRTILLLVGILTLAILVAPKTPRAWHQLTSFVARPVAAFAMDDTPQSAEERANDQSIAPSVDDPQAVAPGESPHDVDDFIIRFGVKWGRRYKARRYGVASFRLVMDSLGLSPPDAIEIDHVPYCPNDDNQLDYQDSDGHRPLFDEDDVGGYVGSTYCTACNEAFKLAPGYRKRMPLREFWKQIDAEYGTD